MFVASSPLPVVGLVDTRSRNSRTIDGGNFGAPPNPPNSASKSRPSRVDRVVERRAVEGRPAGQLDGPGQRLADAARGLGHLTGPVGPGIVDRLQQLPEARLPVPRLVGEVGPGEERAALVVEHAGHRPTALPGERDRRLHVDRVDIGPLLAVDLDVHVVLVHVRRGRLVLERLVRHHVAPVAGGVPHAQQDRHVALPRLRERLIAPLPPVDGVVLVLEQVRRGGIREPVRHTSCLPQKPNRRTPGCQGGRAASGQARQGRRPPRRAPTGGRAASASERSDETNGPVTGGAEARAVPPFRGSRKTGATVYWCRQRPVMEQKNK